MQVVCLLSFLKAGLVIFTERSLYPSRVCKQGGDFAVVSSAVHGIKREDLWYILDEPFTFHSDLFFLRF